MSWQPKELNVASPNLENKAGKDRFSIELICLVDSSKEDDNSCLQLLGIPPKVILSAGAIVRLSCSGDGDAKQEAITKYRNTTTTTTNHRDTIQENIMNHQKYFCLNGKFSFATQGFPKSLSTVL